MTSTKWFFSSAVRSELPRHLEEAAAKLVSSGSAGGTGVVVASASEILGDRALPIWSGHPQTKYLILLDVPPAAIVLLPGRLNLRRPDKRLFVTADDRSIRRLIVSQYRDHPGEGIVDAFALESCLMALDGDLTLHKFPLERIPALGTLDPDRVSDFAIDPDGSFLHWESVHLHLGVSELWKETDLDYLVRLEMQRAERDTTGAVLAQMRASRGLRQSDVPELSERQVRRLEKGESHFTAPTAEKLARAFSQSLPEFLDEFSRLSGQVAQSPPAGDEMKRDAKAS